MNLDFQTNILAYLAQNKRGQQFIADLDSKLFELVEDQTIFGLISRYSKKYNTNPSRTNLLEFFNTFVKEKDLNPTDIKLIKSTVSKIYTRDLGDDIGLIEDKIRVFAQYSRTNLIFDKYAGKLKEGSHIYQQMHAELTRVVNIGKNELADNSKGGFLLAEHSRAENVIANAIPSQYSNFNRTLSTRGLVSPMILVFMAPPKGFKTGTLINFALGFMRDGYNVYVADFENGVTRYKNRLHQAMLGATIEELTSGELDEDLKNLANSYKALGGDMVNDFYSPKKHDLNDIDARLEQLWQDFGWKPNIIMYDYLDLAMPIDKSIKDRRLQIQEVFHDARALNNKWGTSAITPSHVNRKGSKKEEFDPEDIGEDFGKVGNADGIYALARNASDIANGYIRMQTVAMRDGAEKVNALFKINPARMIMEEVGVPPLYDPKDYVIEEQNDN